MNLSYSAEEIAFRNEVRTFLESRLPQEIRRRVRLGQVPTKDDMKAWHGLLADQGWLTPEWPAEWGGKGWSAVQLYIFNEEMHRASAPPLQGFNVNLVGPVICAFGTPEQQQKFLPKLPRLDYWFCQGFSEPGAGSDLAALKTRAVRAGDHYVINGQKLWTSGAHLSDWMFGLFRTDADAVKQKGISYILVDMKSPGITVRPIITLGGIHHCNEVFFDNVRVPVANLIGEENKGWTYAKFLMGNARTSVARIGQSKARIGKAKAMAAGIRSGEGSLADQPRFREKLAAIEVELKALEITNMRAIAERRKKNEARLDPKSSILKLKGSELQQLITELLLEVAGPHAMARQADFYEARTNETIGPQWAATAATNYFFTRAVSIFSGTNEIQHNIIAKNILGL